jgi:hypothetical protein
MNYLKDLREFAKKQASVFFINLILAALFGILLAKLGGKYAREFEALLNESLPFKSILVVLPIELLVCGIVLLLLSIPPMRGLGGPWSQKYVLQPFAEFGAGLSAVAIAVVLGVAIAAAIVDSGTVAIGLAANSVLLVVMLLLVFAVPYISSPTILGATTGKALIGWGVFFVAGAVFLLAYSYPMEKDECAKCQRATHAIAQNQRGQARINPP